MGDLVGIFDADDEEFRDDAREGRKQIRAFLAYEGTNPKYLQNAKMGAVLVSSYVKHYASQTNRAALRLAFGKQQKTLTGGE